MVLQIVAIMMGRNCAPTLARILDHLRANQICVVFIDHGSTDATGEIARSYCGDCITNLLFEPYDGVFRLARQLDIKRDVIRTLSADWIIHIDSDEIFESPKEGESLREMIERIDAAGKSIIDCDEFVFVPGDASEDFEGRDFVAEMRRYYHFDHPKRRNQRAFRIDCGVEMWGRTGGHAISTDPSLVADERIRYRHYIGLSLAHLQRQYVGRVFSGEEIRKSWHLNRIPTSPDLIVLPPPDRLFDLGRDGWRTDQPENRHLIFSQRHPFTPPKLPAAPRQEPPMPFIVGVSRSGTTLLRFMIDAHTDVSIPPETHWLLPLKAALEQPDASFEGVELALKGAHNWSDMDVPEAELRSLFRVSKGADFIRGIYKLYAHRHGTARYGDKTPPHLLNLGAIAGLLPEARFIHITRDGRDVARSLKGLWFGPGDDIEGAALMWMWRITQARQQAQFLPHYLECRFEDLVTKPRDVLQRICAFLELGFQEQMLVAHERAEERLQELGALQTDKGTLSAEQRREIHDMTKQPPSPDRIGRWRTGLSALEISRFERLAGDLLQDLGYELSD